MGGVVYVVHSVDLETLADTAEAAARDPRGLAVALGAYALAFALRAGLWCRALPGLSFGQSLSALHVSLAGNHLLPLRLGEPLRVVSVVRRTRVPVAAATASTVLLRAADILAVVAIAALLGPEVAEDLLGGGADPAGGRLGACCWSPPRSGLARVVRRAGYAPARVARAGPAGGDRGVAARERRWSGAAPAGRASTSRRATRPWSRP